MLNPWLNYIEEVEKGRGAREGGETYTSSSDVCKFPFFACIVLVLKQECRREGRRGEERKGKKRRGEGKRGRKEKGKERVGGYHTEEFANT